MQSVTRFPAIVSRFVHTCQCCITLCSTCIMRAWMEVSDFPDPSFLGWRIWGAQITTALHARQNLILNCQIQKNHSWNASRFLLIFIFVNKQKIIEFSINKLFDGILNFLSQVIWRVYI
jgi:hypothetical protein